MARLDKQTEEQWQLGQKIENDLRQIIHDRVYVDEKFIEQINSIVNEFGDDVYSILLHLLCRQRFTVTEARTHWGKILALYDVLTDKLGMDGPIDIRLALVHYFLHDDGGLERPALVDLAVFDKIQKSAYQDELTSLFNFRYLKEHLEQELQRAKRYGSVVSLVMLDIDDFKFYNDNSGHEEGNRALIEFGKILHDSIRRMDTAIRYGGEEFCLILPATNKNGALIVYDRIQKCLREAGIEHAGDQPKGYLSASAGVATFPADAASANGLVRCADNAMYTAKRLGKDQIHIYGDNRRSHQRINTKLSGHFSLGHPDEKFTFTTIDISEGGLMIVTDMFVPVGALLDIHINLRAGGGTVNFPGRVLRCDAGEDERHYIGLNIVEMLSQDRVRLHAFINEQST